MKANTTTIRANPMVKIYAECDNSVVDSDGSLHTASGTIATLIVYGYFIKWKCRFLYKLLGQLMAAFYLQVLIL